MNQVLPAILSKSRTEVIFGPGSIDRLGETAAGLGAGRVLLVTDPGIVAAGHVEHGLQSLRAADLHVNVFDGVRENPTTEHVAAGVETARKADIDFIVGLGGGSSLDCAKGINFILTNGGRMQDYWGVGKASKAMLDMIAVPTTAGTGSEAQSFALISDPETHQKMACGDPKAACRAAILDPDLTRTQPSFVAATTGIDAVSHAVETAATTKRNEISLEFTREAWTRLARSFVTAISDPSDDAARADMLLGAHLAGAAIEHSMLGAAHSCANPLTAHFGLVHGLAVGLMLPHVIRFNSSNGSNPYASICGDGEELASTVEKMLDAAGATSPERGEENGRRVLLERHLGKVGVPYNRLETLAAEAETQWTAQFNPREVKAAEFLELYRRAF